MHWTALDFDDRALSCTDRQVRGRTPQGESRRQTPRRPLQEGSRVGLMPGGEGRCTNWPGSSAV